MSLRTDVLERRTQSGFGTGVSWSVGQRGRPLIWLLPETEKSLTTDVPTVPNPRDINVNSGSHCVSSPRP